MFNTNFLSIEQIYEDLATCFNLQTGSDYTFPIFDNEFLSSSKPIKIGVKDFVFPTKQDHRCDYNSKCFMYVGLILDDIVMNFFNDTTEKQERQVKNIFFQDKA